MRADRFGVLLIVAEVAGVALALATHPVVSGVGSSLWLTVRYGYLGVLVLLAATFPIIRRWKFVWMVLGFGGIPLVIAGVLFSGKYANLQMWWNGEGTMNVAELSKRPIENPALVKLSGVWRYDLSYHGKRRIARQLNNRALHRCQLATVYFCRTPVVAPGWKPGEPVLALSDHCGVDRKARHRTAEVRLFPAKGRSIDNDAGFSGFGVIDTERAGKTISCYSRPDDQHIDMNKAPFHFDAARGALVVSTAFEWPHPETDFFWLGLYLALVLWVTKLATRDDDGKPGRIAREGEKSVETEAE